MKIVVVMLSLVLFSTVAMAQDGTAVQNTPGMDHSQMPGMPGGESMNMLPDTFVREILNHGTSGTSAEPNSTPIPMLMKRTGSWMLMFHANIFILDEQQSNQRGADRFFSTNWFMPMAQRKLGRGVFTGRVMLSAEPATITDRRYPLLFQQGETAYGVPIADGQHPHNLFMEIAAIYDVKLGTSSLVSFYVAPVGDPAIGPTAYPHRASAFEDPVATLGHHQEDSTHISDDVVTVGFTHRIVKIEASGFHGREPDENRWTITQGTIDSWATRLTVQPGKNWSGQYSYARIASPEALFPTESQERMTASVMYNRPLHFGNWASTLLWGRTRSLQDRAVFNSYLFESTVQFQHGNYVWTRIESAERSNELIIGENPVPPRFEEKPIAQVQAYALGYGHDIHLVPHLASAIGIQATTYGVPSILQLVYGAHPSGVAVFIRLRPFSE